MIRLEIARLLRDRIWRWALGIAMSVGLGFLSRHWLATYHALGTANVWDLVLAGVTQFYVATVILPGYYLLLVADLAVSDLDGHVVFMAGRLSSRFEWWIAKVVALTAAAILVIVLVLGGLFCVGLIAGLPFRGTWSAYVREGGAYEMFRVAGSSLVVVWHDPLLAVGQFAVFAIGTLVSVGLAVMAVSMWLRSAWMPWALGTMGAVATYAVWMIQPADIRWMPTAQMMLLQHVLWRHVLFFGRRPDLWSFGYLAAMGALGVCGGFWRVRTMALSNGMIG